VSISNKKEIYNGPKNNPTFYICLLETVQSNRLLTTIRRLSTEWSLSFDLFISSYHHQYCSIIHLTQNHDQRDFGDRVPAVFLTPSQSIQISTYIDRLPDYKVLHEVPPYNWFRFVISHEYLSNGQYRYSIQLDDEEIHWTVNNMAHQFYNVKVYAGNPWMEPCNASLANLQLTNFL